MLIFTVETLAFLTLVGLFFYLKFGLAERADPATPETDRDALEILQRMLLRDRVSASSRQTLMSLTPGPDFCEAARREAVVRHEFGEEPRLPLTDCSRRDSCACRYQRAAEARSKTRH